MATTSSTVTLTFSWGSPASAPLRRPASSTLPTNTAMMTCLYQLCIRALLHHCAAAQRVVLACVVLPLPSCILGLHKSKGRAIPEAQTWPKHQLHRCGNYWILLQGNAPNLAAV